MAIPYVLVEKEFQNGKTVGIGITRDNWLDEQNPTRNNGLNNKLWIGDGYSGVTRQDTRAVIEIQMPRDEDILGFDVLEKVEVLLKLVSKDASKWMIIGIVEIGDIWDEGGQIETPGWSNWTEAQPAVPWEKGNGAIKSRVGSLDDEDRVIDSVRDTLVAGDYTAINYWRTWDLTPVLNMGDKTSFVIFDLDREDGTNNQILFGSNEWVTASEYPILKLTYRSYHPDGFTEDADKLRIEPNPDYPIQPKLTWGVVKASDFFQYKLYRSTSPITSVDGFKFAITAVDTGNEKFTIAGDHTAAFPVGSTFKTTGRTGRNGRWTVASVIYSGGNTIIETDEDITDATVDGDIHGGIYTTTDSAIIEFIDTFSSAAGTRYYYRLIAEDQDNHEDAALLSATVSWTVPNVTTRSIVPSGAQNVGVEVTLTVTADRLIKRLNVDWKDGSQSWYEYETTSLTQTVKHRYSKHSSAGPWNPVLTIEDDLGFWSYGYLTSNSITISDLAPEAKLLVNVKKAIEGDSVTLNGSLSQPQAANSTITKYEFKRYAADSWQDNGTDPVFTFSTAAFGTGTITASLRITTSTSLQDTDTVTYDLESGTPTEITPGVTGGLSIQTAIHELPHRLATDKSVGVPIGSAGVAHEYEIARQPERFTIHATTEYPSMEADIGIIRNAWLNNSYLRLTVKTEMETKDVQYDFMLDGDVSLGHITDNKITWSFPVRVLVRTEVAKPKVKGDITVWANPGGGKVTATSNGHGLSVGMSVLITGTINYNGTYVITNVTANTFRFTATWVADDAMGLWRKPGVS